MFVVVYDKPYDWGATVYGNLYLHPYLDNGVPNFLKMWYGDSSYSYLGLCKSRHNNYNAICLFLTFFVKTSLLIFPIIFAQSLLNFHKIVL